jgi:hypothetical protein
VERRFIFDGASLTAGKRYVARGKSYTRSFVCPPRPLRVWMSTAAEVPDIHELMSGKAKRVAPSRVTSDRIGR